MRAVLVATVGVTLLAFAITPSAEAKKFRYASGPKAPQDTVLSVSNAYLDPVVRSRGPRVPYTNFQVIQLVADSAFATGIGPAPLDSGSRVVLAPALDHPLNFAVQEALLKALSARAIEVTVRRSPIADDSLRALYVSPGDPVLEYTLASARVSYLRLVGYLPGRVKIERQGLVQGLLSLRDPESSRILWTNRVGLALSDRFPRSDLGVVEDDRYPDLKAPPPGRSVDKVFEPILVVAVVGGLVALFFQNRP